MGKVTLQTIADHVGVSRMTVSNAFSRPDQLSTELRERILTAAEEFGYCGPDPTARMLARGTTGTIGVLLTDSLRYAFADEVAAEFLGAIAEELAPTGLALTLLTSSTSTERMPARDVPMDGSLVYSCDDRSAAVAWLIRRRLPLVLVDQEPRPGYASVNIDDRGGARKAAQHLVDLGHRRISIVTYSVSGAEGVLDDPRGQAGSFVGRQRMAGWLDALDAAGIRPTVVQLRKVTEELDEELAMLLLDGPERPTAVLCVSDVTAFRVVDAAASRGLSVPEQLSVVGFDDSPLANRMRPQLTTVRQDTRTKGRKAATALLTAIERAKAGTVARVRSVTLPTELVVRGSTAPV